LLSVAIIGAGPYGLSLAAYLRAAGIEHRVFGSTMESWRHGMPPGMLLKSHAWSATFYDPGSRLTLKAFSEAEGLAYHDYLIPTPVETFVRYGEAFQARFAPDATDAKLVDLAASPGGFRARFDNGESVLARRVVLALGVRPFAHVPTELCGLPSERLTHSADHGPLDGFAGKRLAVIGGGASASDLAALAHEAGATVTLVARARELRFAAKAPANPRPPPKPRSPRAAWRRLTSPTSGIGPGWPYWILANVPEAFVALPGPVRRRITRTTLGPLGEASVRERLSGAVDVRLGRRLAGASATRDGVELQLRTGDGQTERIWADHVVAATGYRIDVDRLGFLDPGLQTRLRAAHGAPVLSSKYETSVPGLHVIGPASADSFGPVARFVYGAIHPARRLSRLFASERERASAPVRVDVGASVTSG
jgi:cation diffusion facilitator CzcD-associated flavoprotein CzcO